MKLRLWSVLIKDGEVDIFLGEKFATPGVLPPAPRTHEKGGRYLRKETVVPYNYYEVYWDKYYPNEPLRENYQFLAKNFHDAVKVLDAIRKSEGK